MTCKHPDKAIVANRYFAGWLWAYCKDCREDLRWCKDATNYVPLATINFFKAGLT